MKKIKSIEITKLTQLIDALAELRAMVSVDPAVLRREREYTQSHVVTLAEINGQFVILLS